jgi:hypothetical protein
MIGLPLLLLIAGIAAEPDAIWSIAADEREVFWANSAELRAAPVDGGAIRTLARLPASEHEEPAAHDLEVTPTHVVWWNGDSIWAVKRAGGKPRRLGRAAHSYQTVGGFVTDGTRVYFRRSSKLRGTERWRGEIWVAPIASGGGKRVARLPSAAGALALSGDFLYWSVGASVVRMKKSGGAVTAVVEDVLAPRFGSGITDVAVIGDDPYYVLDGVVKRNRAVVPGLTGLDGLTDKGFIQADGERIVLVPRDGGAPETIEKDLKLLRGVRPVGAWIYFQAAGQIRRVTAP